MDPYKGLRKTIDESLAHVKVPKEVSTKVLQQAIYTSSPESQSKIRWSSYISGACTTLLLLGAIQFFVDYKWDQDLVSTNSPISAINEGVNDKLPDKENRPLTAALAPGYVPADYEMKEVVSTTANKDSAPILTIRFVSEDGSFELSQSEAELPVDGAFQEVKLEGKSGKLRVYGEAELELHWNDGASNFYRLKGKISEKEAIKIAGSLRMPIFQGGK